MKVCIDPGHGGTDPGAIGAGPECLREKVVNLEMAFALEAELKRLEHSVIMTRRRDRTLSLSARARFANRYVANVFISLHANAGASPAAEGIEVFHFPQSEAGFRIADRVLQRVSERFPDHKNRGIKESNFAVLRLTAMPAILLECEFITNPRQAAFLSDKDNQRSMAAAIASGLNTISNV